MILEHKVNEFFRTARERQKMYKAKEAGEPWPWSEDAVMNNVYLCNLFREQDKTTVWFRENVRDPEKESFRVFPAIVLFRWFNRVETGKHLFGGSIFNDWVEMMIHKGNPEAVGNWLSNKIEEMNPPYFTGAYMIKVDNGMQKHHSVSIAASAVVEGFLHRFKEANTPILFDRLQGWTEWLTGFHGLGGFMSYEIASDLRWTILGRKSIDINSWANVGPGCARGLSRLYFETHTHAEDFLRERSRANDVMIYLHQLSRDEKYWPQSGEPKWEMREVEHWCCEFDKIERARAREGRIKRWYKPSPNATRKEHIRVEGIRDHAVVGQGS